MVILLEQYERFLPSLNARTLVEFIQTRVFMPVEKRFRSCNISLNINLYKKIMIDYMTMKNRGVKILKITFILSQQPSLNHLILKYRLYKG